MMLSGKELQAKTQNNKDRQKEYLYKHREKQKNRKTVQPKDFQSSKQKASAMKKTSTTKKSLPQTIGRRVSVIKYFLENMKSP